MAKLGRIFFQLDVNWYDEWGYLVSTDAAMLWIIGSCLSKRLISDGIIPISQLRNNSPRSLSDEQFAAALHECVKTPKVPLDEVDDEHIQIRGWLSWNDSADDIAAMQEGGEYGNHVKWHVKRGLKPKKPCEFCDPSIGSIGGRVGGRIAPDIGTRLGEDIQETETETETETEVVKTIAPIPPPRPRDEIWDAVVDACGINMKEITSASRGACNKAVKELRAANANPLDIPKRASIFRQRYPSISLTPTALAKHWPALGTKAVGEMREDRFGNRI